MRTFIIEYPKIGEIESFSCQILRHILNGMVDENTLSSLQFNTSQFINYIFDKIILYPSKIKTSKEKLSIFANFWIYLKRYCDFFKRENNTKNLDINNIYEDVIFPALILAAKYHLDIDEIMTWKHYSGLCNKFFESIKIKTTDIFISIELKFLTAIDWRLHVTRADLESLITYINKENLLDFDRIINFYKKSDNKAENLVFKIENDNLFLNNSEHCKRIMDYFDAQLRVLEDESSKYPFDKNFYNNYKSNYSELSCLENEVRRFSDAFNALDDKYKSDLKKISERIHILNDQFLAIEKIKIIEMSYIPFDYAYNNLTDQGDIENELEKVAISFGLELGIGTRKLDKFACNILNAIIKPYLDNLILWFKENFNLYHKDIFLHKLAELYTLLLVIEHFNEIMEEYYNYELDIELEIDQSVAKYAKQYELILEGIQKSILEISTLQLNETQKTGWLSLYALFYRSTSFLENSTFINSENIKMDKDSWYKAINQLLNFNTDLFEKNENDKLMFALSVKFLILDSVRNLFNKDDKAQLSISSNIVESQDVLKKKIQLYFEGIKKEVADYIKNELDNTGENYNNDRASKFYSFLLNVNQRVQFIQTISYNHFSDFSDVLVILAKEFREDVSKAKSDSEKILYDIVNLKSENCLIENRVMLSRKFVAICKHLDHVQRSYFNLKEMGFNFALELTTTIDDILSKIVDYETDNLYKIFNAFLSEINCIESWDDNNILLLSKDGIENWFKYRDNLIFKLNEINKVSKEIYDTIPVSCSPERIGQNINSQFEGFRLIMEEKLKWLIRLAPSEVLARGQQILSECFDKSLPSIDEEIKVKKIQIMHYCLRRSINSYGRHADLLELFQQIQKHLGKKTESSSSQAFFRVHQRSDTDESSTSKEHRYHPY